MALSKKTVKQRTANANKRRRRRQKAAKGQKPLSPLNAVDTGFGKAVKTGEKRRKLDHPTPLPDLEFAKNFILPENARSNFGNTVELSLQTFEEAFRDCEPLDISIKSNHKTPKAVEEFGMRLWTAYWRYRPLYIPGEAWLRVPLSSLSAFSGKGQLFYHVQPWRKSLLNTCKFARRFFSYPKIAPANLDDKNAENWPHPARLADFVRPPRDPENWLNDRPYILFELLFTQNVYEDIGIPPQICQYALRALLRLFRELQCHHVNKRHRLIIVPMWKDARIESLQLPNPVLGLHKTDGSGDNFWNKDPSTKRVIPDGLGIKERYLEYINSMLQVWSDFCNEKERMAAHIDDSDSDDAGTPGANAARDGVNDQRLINRMARATSRALNRLVFPLGSPRQQGYTKYWFLDTFGMRPDTSDSRNMRSSLKDKNLEDYLMYLGPPRVYAANPAIFKRDWPVAPNLTLPGAAVQIPWGSLLQAPNLKLAYDSDDSIKR